MFRAGIIHRDLKPANIMWFNKPASEGGSTVKVGDFGMSRMERGRGYKIQSKDRGGNFYSGKVSMG